MPLNLMAQKDSIPPAITPTYNISDVYKLPCVDTLAPKTFFSEKFSYKKDTVAALVWNGFQLEHIPVSRIRKFDGKKEKDVQYSIVNTPPRPLFIKKDYILRIFTQ